MTHPFSVQEDVLYTLRTEQSSGEPSFIYPDEVSDRRLREWPVEFIQNDDLFSRSRHFLNIKKNEMQSAQFQQVEQNTKHFQINTLPIQQEVDIRESYQNRLLHYQNGEDIKYNEQLQTTQIINQLPEQLPLSPDRSTYQMEAIKYEYPPINQEIEQVKMNQQRRVRSISNQAVNFQPQQNPQYYFERQSYQAPNQQFQQVLVNPQQPIFLQQQIPYIIPREQIPVRERQEVTIPISKSSHNINNNNINNHNNNNIRNSSSSKKQKIFLNKSVVFDSTAFSTPQKNTNFQQSHIQSSQPQSINISRHLLQQSQQKNVAKSPFQNAFNNIHCSPYTVTFSPSYVQGSEGQPKSVLINSGEIKKPVISFQKVNKWPSLISNLKQNNSGFRAELECLFELDQKSKMPTQCVRMKRRIENFIDISIDTVWSISKKQEDIREGLQLGDIKKYSNEFFFSTEQALKKVETSRSSVKSQNNINIPEMRLAKGVEVIQGLEKRQFDALSDASYQLELCLPTDSLNPISHNFVLELWNAQQLHTLRGLKEQLKSKFEDSNILKQLQTEIVWNQFTSLSRENLSQSPMDRLISFINLENSDNNFQLKYEYQYFKSLMKCLIESDEAAQLAQKQCDSAVWSYQSFLNSMIEQINQQLHIIRIYLRYVRQCQIGLSDLQIHLSDFFLAVRESDDISQNLQKELKLPFNLNKYYNMQKINYFTSRKIQIRDYITLFTHQANQSQQKLQKTLEQLPCTQKFLTPFDEEIFKVNEYSTQAIDKLQSFDSFVQRLVNLEEASTKAFLMYQDIQNWIIQNTEKPNSQSDLRKKLADISQVISNLMTLKGSLTFNPQQQILHQQRMKTEEAQLIFPIIQNEQSGLNDMINKIHEFHDSLENSISHETSGRKISSSRQIHIDQSQQLQQLSQPQQQQQQQKSRYSLSVNQQNGIIPNHNSSVQSSEKPTLNQNNKLFKKEIQSQLTRSEMQGATKDRATNFMAKNNSKYF